MSITVLDPGPLTTVQDAGRLGYAAQGYRTCGAADSYAYRLGNALVGNTPRAAVLEYTLRGAALRFEQDTIFALTGAESPAALDGTPVPYYAPLLAKAGSTLQMGMAAAGLRTFTHGVYTLTPNCDRMACKLAGPAIAMKNGADILSDGIAAGSVQISADGQPIVMLADHQTTGGYAKIATVISADLPALAQLRPGQAVAFDFVTPAQAVQAARQQAQILQQVAARL